MDPFIGEIRIFSFSKIPTGWLACNGQVLSVPAYQALFSLLGAKYGGNGTTTFALPDLRGRMMVGTGLAKSGTTYSQGVAGGTENVALTTSQMPNHFHYLQAQATAGAFNLNIPAPLEVLAQPTLALVPTAVVNTYNSSPSSNTDLNPATLDITGTGAAHENRVPILALNICIAANGLYPPKQ
ncbi:MAG: tail fiber protein [Bacteroidetes bacterium]|nr:tail fiber protein [Bacteroidota bacterium]